MVNSKPAQAALPRTLIGLSMHLILITGLVRLGSSLYLPALPAMGSELNLSAPQLVFTMTVYLIVFSVSSVFLGPLADSHGRRVLILGGIAVYLAGSALCAVTEGYDLLIAGRILQAIGGGAIPVATRAMARDAFDDRKLVAVLGWIGTVTALVPILAPVLGGLITQGLGWRSTFYLLVGAALITGLCASRQIPETLPSEDRQPFSATGILKSYIQMLRTPEFMIPMLPLMMCYAAQGAYLVASPFIFIHLLQMKPASFGSTSLILVAALLAGRSVCMVLLKRWSLYLTYVTGGALTFAGGLTFFATSLTGPPSAFAILATSALFCLGFGALLPIGMKAGLSAFPLKVGTSSALFGCMTLGATAAGSGVVGEFLERTAQDIFSLGIVILVAGGLALFTCLLCRSSLATASRQALPSSARN